MAFVKRKKVVVGPQFTRLIAETEIRDRVKKLGQEITGYYRNLQAQKIFVIGVLKGSFIFMADLVRSLEIPCEIDFIELNSYDGTNSTGSVKMLRDAKVALRGQHVLVVEDIVDTGHTVHFLIGHLEKTHQPGSVRICTLLDKPSRRVQKEVKADFIGFEIPDHFVVGYGLDFNNEFREKKDLLIYRPPQ